MAVTRVCGYVWPAARERTLYTIFASERFRECGVLLRIDGDRGTLLFRSNQRGAYQTAFSRDRLANRTLYHVACVREVFNAQRVDRGKGICELQVEPNATAGTTPVRARADVLGRRSDAAVFAAELTAESDAVVRARQTVRLTGDASNPIDTWFDARALPPGMCRVSGTVADMGGRVLDATAVARSRWDGTRAPPHAFMQPSR